MYNEERLINEVPFQSCSMYQEIVRYLEEEEIKDPSFIALKIIPGSVAYYYNNKRLNQNTLSQKYSASYPLAHNKITPSKIPYEESNLMNNHNSNEDNFEIEVSDSSDERDPLRKKRSLNNNDNINDNQYSDETVSIKDNRNNNHHKDYDYYMEHNCYCLVSDVKRRYYGQYKGKKFHSLICCEHKCKGKARLYLHTKKIRIIQECSLNMHKSQLLNSQQRKDQRERVKELIINEQLDSIPAIQKRWKEINSDTPLKLKDSAFNYLIKAYCNQND